MKGGILVALLNPALTLLLGLAFLILWSYRPYRRYLAVLAFAYLASSVGFLLQYFTLFGSPELSRVGSILAFLAGAIALSDAVLARYRLPLPNVALTLLAGLGLAAFCWYMFVEPDLTARIYAINMSLGVIAFLVAWRLRKIENKTRADWLILSTTVLIALNLVVRTVVILALDGPYDSYDGFRDSFYWTSSMLSHALFSLLIALGLFTAEALDLLQALRDESRKDVLSGLLNRRGFEERAAAALNRARAGKLPAALILADLDHFKSVNDEHGHDSGDRVIAAFASLLDQAAGKDAVVGRLGGEEFGVLLPACGPGAARLFAEGVRAAFAATVIDGLPPEARFTASFGVATAGPEGLATLLLSADQALYRAKRSGRDRVAASNHRFMPEAKSVRGAAAS